MECAFVLKKKEIKKNSFFTLRNIAPTGPLGSCSALTMANAVPGSNLAYLENLEERLVVDAAATESGDTSVMHTSRLSQSTTFFFIGASHFAAILSQMTRRSSVASCDLTALRNSLATLRHFFAERRAAAPTKLSARELATVLPSDSSLDWSYIDKLYFRRDSTSQYWWHNEKISGTIPYRIIRYYSLKAILMRCGFRFSSRLNLRLSSSRERCRNTLAMKLKSVPMVQRAL